MALADKLRQHCLHSNSKKGKLLKQILHQEYRLSPAFTISLLHYRKAIKAVRMPNSESRTSPQPHGVANLVAHCKQHKIEVGMWATRLLTIIFTISYFLPVFGNHPYPSYYKALMSNAATSALRLHQRLPRVSLTRQFAATLLLEDSAHYLMFSLLFLFAADPVTVALIPIVLFAVLHASSYTLTLLDSLMGRNSADGWLGKLLISLVELHSRTILRMVAFSEIFLMPLTAMLVFSGRVSLVTPFLFYRFLGLRYTSRRNPYTRAVFNELKVSLEQTAASPSIPQALRSLIYRGIAAVSNMAPPMAPPAQ